MTSKFSTFSKLYIQLEQARVFATLEVIKFQSICFSPILYKDSEVFNCHAYFDNLNVTLLDWSKIEEIEKLERQIAML
jgi:hypothetical protein